MSQLSTLTCSAALVIFKRKQPSVRKTHILRLQETVISQMRFKIYPWAMGSNMNRDVPTGSQSDKIACPTLSRRQITFNRILIKVRKKNTLLSQKKVIVRLEKKLTCGKKRQMKYISCSDLAFGMFPLDIGHKLHSPERLNSQILKKAQIF